MDENEREYDLIVTIDLNFAFQKRPCVGTWLRGSFEKGKKFNKDDYITIGAFRLRKCDLRDREKRKALFAFLEDNGLETENLALPEVSVGEQYEMFV